MFGLKGRLRCCTTSPQLHNAKRKLDGSPTEKTIDQPFVKLESPPAQPNDSPTIQQKTPITLTNAQQQFIATSGALAGQTKSPILCQTTAPLHAEIENPFFPLTTANSHPKPWFFFPTSAPLIVDTTASQNVLASMKNHVKFTAKPENPIVATDPLVGTAQTLQLVPVLKYASENLSDSYRPNTTNSPTEFLTDIGFRNNAVPHRNYTAKHLALTLILLAHSPVRTLAENLAHSLGKKSSGSLRKKPDEKPDEKSDEKLGENRAKILDENPANNLSHNLDENKSGDTLNHNLAHNLAHNSADNPADNVTHISANVLNYNLGHDLAHNSADNPAHILAPLPLFRQLLQTIPHITPTTKETRVKSNTMATIWQKGQGADNPVDWGPTAEPVRSF